MNAQSTNGEVTGTVTDQSGNVVPGALVTITDTARGVAFKAMTNDAGVYHISLPIGNYKAQVTKTGFETLRESAFDLELGQTDRLDFTLKVGAATEIVEVSGEEAPLLKVESDQLDTIIDEKTTEDLPLATRNYVQMTLLVPGATNTNPASMTTAQNQQSAGRPLINGNNEQSNNFLLDGLENNQISDNLIGYAPSIDAIQEFTIITQDPSAEFGNFEGGTITTAIKSGTNGYHGSAYEFFRNDIFNAAPWYDSFTGATKPTVRWNMFGATFGGPILKNKLFFFGDFQGQRFDTPASILSGSVLTEQERAGDFSDLPDQTPGVPYQLYDPGTAVGTPANPGTCNGNINVSGNRCALTTANGYAGFNKLPHVDAAAAAILASPLIPAPNNGTGPGANLNYSQRSALNENQGDIKVDYAMSDKDHIFARASKYYTTNPFINSVAFIQDPYTNGWGDSGIAGWTHQITPSLINDFRFGTNYTKIAYGDTDTGTGTLATTAGVANANSNAGHPVTGMPQFNLNNSQGLTALGSAGADALFADTSIQFDEGLTWIHRTHTVTAGFQYRRYRINTFYAGNDGENGQINFSGIWTAPNPASEASGNGGADFVYGTPTQTQRGAAVGVWGQRADMLAGYVQDDWKVTSTLTFNIGLRYDNHTPWYEINGKALNFDLKTGQPVYLSNQQTATLNTIYSAYNPETSNLKGGYNSYNLGWDFQPRLGFAWTPAAFHGKGVLRGAYGVTSYMEGSGTNLRLTENTPFVPDNSAYFTANAVVAPSQTLEDGFPANLTPNLQSAKLRAWNPNVRPAVDNMWNLAVQYQLTGHDTIQAAYVGQKVTHTLVPMNYAQFTYNTAGQVVPGPNLGQAANYNTSNPTLFQVPNLPSGLPGDPNSMSGWVAGTGSVGNQGYNALQATLQHRFDKGLEVQLAYTYSKCMADNIGYYGGSGQSSPSFWYWQNQYDQKAEWGPCYFDSTQILTGYAVYSLPFGHRQAFGANMNNVANAIVGNWQIGAMTTDHTGFAVTAIDSVNVPAYGATGSLDGVERADCNGPIHYVHKFYSAPGNEGEQFFDNSTGVSVTASPTGFGTCSNGSLRGPGLSTFDASLQKQFSIFESLHSEFRFEAVNVLNHPIFNQPDMTVSDASFGVSKTTTATQGARQLQLALKFTF
jgi:hypothetical protein